MKRFERDRTALKPHPVIAIDTCYHDTRRVSIDGYVDVRGNRYSVSAQLCGDMVAIHITPDADQDHRSVRAQFPT
jgi:hypothetical protein